MNKVLGLILLSLLGSSVVSASEHDHAKRLCEQSMALYQKELKKKKPISMCHINVRSAEYWQCVVNKQKAGEPFAFSTNQCDKVDPQ